MNVKARPPTHLDLREEFREKVCRYQEEIETLGVLESDGSRDARQIATTIAQLRSAQLAALRQLLSDQTNGALSDRDLLAAVEASLRLGGSSGQTSRRTRCDSWVEKLITTLDGRAASVAAPVTSDRTNFSGELTEEEKQDQEKQKQKQKQKQGT
jgi:hypothetical protein